MNISNTMNSVLTQKQNIQDFYTLVSNSIPQGSPTNAIKDKLLNYIKNEASSLIYDIATGMTQ